MEQIPQTIEDLVKKIFTDVKEERIDDVSADEFANKWLKKTKTLTSWKSWKSFVALWESLTRTMGLVYDEAPLPS